VRLHRVDVGSANGVVGVCVRARWVHYSERVTLTGRDRSCAIVGRAISIDYSDRSRPIPGSG
jgi:hypothetical protein